MNTEIIRHLLKIVKSEISTKKDEKHKTILSIWYFKSKRLPDGRLTKQKYRLSVNGLILRWGVNYWENYASVVNWICVSSLFATASIHEFTSISIDVLISSPQVDLDVDVFMKIPLGMGVGGNSG